MDLFQFAFSSLQLSLHGVVDCFIGLRLRVVLRPLSLMKSGVFLMGLGFVFFSVCVLRQCICLC